MTAENVIPADLVTVKWSADGSNPQPVPGCKTVGIPEVSQEYRDRTSLDSPDRFKEYGLGMKDTGELTLSCFYSKEVYSQASSFHAAGKPVHFEIEFPPVEGQSSGDKVEYRAYVLPAIPTTDYDGDLVTELRLRPTGKPDWTEGAAA